MKNSDAIWEIFRGERQKEPIPYTEPVRFDQWYEPLDLKEYAPGVYQPKRRRYAKIATILATLPTVSAQDSISSMLKSRPKVYADTYRATNLPPFVEIPMPGQAQAENHMTPFNRVKYFNQYFSPVQQQWLPDFKDLSTDTVSPWVTPADLEATGEAVTAFVSQTSLPHESAVANPTEDELEIKAASMKVAQEIRKQGTERKKAMAAAALSSTISDTLMHTYRTQLAEHHTRLPRGANILNHLDLSQHPAYSRLHSAENSGYYDSPNLTPIKPVIPLPVNPNDNPGKIQFAADAADTKYLGSSLRMLQEARNLIGLVPAQGPAGPLVAALNSEELKSSANLSQMGQ